nr:uncharacterized protein C20orf24 homolog isoform X2 [Columba livia]
MCAQLWFVFATSLPSVGENVSATGFPVVSALVRLLLCVPLPAAPSAQARGPWSRRVPAGHAVCGAAPRLLPSLPAWRRCGRRPAVLWGTDDEFLDVIYWFRQIIAVILGIIWGVVPLKGFVGIAVFCLINAGVLYLYFSSFQQIDEEEYGGTWELTKEGFMTSFALFLVVWIIFYTAIHYD